MRLTTLQISTSPTGINREECRVYRAAVITEGPLKGHKLIADATTLQQVWGAMVAVGVESNLRVLIAFAAELGYDRKPALLMAFERQLRAATGDRLEVFAEEMADGNRIRRL